MEHLGTQRLETERLILRRFTVEDAPAMYRNWCSDPEVSRFLSWPPHADVGVTRQVLADWVDAYERADAYQWAIVLKENGDEPIGSIAVVSHDDSSEKAHIGYCIGRKWWHRGIMSEALSAVIDFLLDRVGMGRVEAAHDPDNPHSGGVMRKCGMVYEGTLRKSSRSNQGIVDVCIYAILSTDR